MKQQRRVIFKTITPPTHSKTIAPKRSVMWHAVSRKASIFPLVPGSLVGEIQIEPQSTNTTPRANTNTNRVAPIIAEAVDSKSFIYSRKHESNWSKQGEKKRMWSERPKTSEKRMIIPSAASFWFRRMLLSATHSSSVLLPFPSDPSYTILREARNGELCRLLLLSHPLHKQALSTSWPKADVWWRPSISKDAGWFQSRSA